MPGKHKATYRKGNGTHKINKVSKVGSSAKTVKITPKKTSKGLAK